MTARPVDVKIGDETCMEGRFEVETAAVATFEHSFNSMTSSFDYSFHYRRCIQIVVILYTDGAGLFAIFAVQKKLTLPNQTLRTSELMQIVIDRHDLLCRIWRS